MTDKQWHDIVKTNYETVAADLAAQGYARSKRSDIYKEQFVKGDETLVIIRDLGSPNWWTQAAE